jgi:hypothetical protein
LSRISRKTRIESTHEASTAGRATQCVFTFRNDLPRRILMMNAASGSTGIKKRRSAINLSPT